MVLNRDVKNGSCIKPSVRNSLGDPRFHIVYDGMSPVGDVFEEFPGKVWVYKLSEAILAHSRLPCVGPSHRPAIKIEYRKLIPGQSLPGDSALAKTRNRETGFFLRGPGAIQAHGCSTVEFGVLEIIEEMTVLRLEAEIFIAEYKATHTAHKSPKQMTRAIEAHFRERAPAILAVLEATKRIKYK